MIAAKCTQCGAPIEVDESREHGYCPNCGTEYVTEKIVHNYQQNFNYHSSQVINKTIIGREKTEAEEYIYQADGYMELGKIAKANEKYRLATSSDPLNYKGWLGLFRIESENYGKVVLNDDSSLQTAVRCVKEEDADAFGSQVAPYYRNILVQISRAKLSLNMKLKFNGIKTAIIAKEKEISENERKIFLKNEKLEHLGFFGGFIKSAFVITVFIFCMVVVFFNSIPMITEKEVNDIALLMVLIFAGIAFFPIVVCLLRYLFTLSARKKVKLLLNDIRRELSSLDSRRAQLKIEHERMIVEVQRDFEDFDGSEESFSMLYENLEVLNEQQAMLQSYCEAFVDSKMIKL